VRSRAFALLWLPLAAACSTTEPAAPVVDGTISLTGFIHTIIEVPNLEIAVLGREDIDPVTADDEGTFFVDGLPPGVAFALEVSGTGLVATLQPVRASDNDIYGLRVHAVRTGGTRYADGIGADDVDVFALVQRHDYVKNGLALAQVSIAPAPSEAVDYYNDAAATDLTGRAFFRGVAAGEVELAVDAPGRPCTAAPGWEGSADERVRVPTARGHMTIVEVVCPDTEGSRLVQGKVADAASEEPVVGVEVCVGDSGCTTTNEAGVYELKVEDGEDRVMSAQAADDGYPPTLRALRNEWVARGRIDFEMLSEERVQQLAAAAGISRAGDLGFLSFRATASSAAVTVEPHSTVVYLDSSGAVDMSLTSSSLDGRAFAANVATPTATVAASHPGLTCAIGTAWEWSAEPLAMPTAAGSVTIASVPCFSATPP